MMPGNKNDENRISAILHNTKQKYNELATSLVLTSSLISHKNKIHKIRQIKFQTLQQSPFQNYNQLLLTNKIPLCDYKKNQKEEHQSSISNIDQLKIQAKVLEQNEIIKLGKVQSSNDQLNSMLTIQNDNSEAQLNHQKIKKPNKRKIVKGRPEMYAIIKKRKQLMALIEQQDNKQLPLRNITNQPDIKQAVDQIMNKNNLLKYISTKQQGSFITKNFYDNFLKENQQKTSKERSKTTGDKQTRYRRKSQFNIENNQNINHVLKNKLHQNQSEIKIQKQCQMFQTSKRYINFKPLPHAEFIQI